MNVLAVRHVVDLSRATDTKSACRALVDELHVDGGTGYLRLAKPVVKQFFRDVSILLAHLNVQPVGTTVHDTGLGQDVLTGDQDQEPPPSLHSASEFPMLQDIPTHVIAGPLGAGKTSLIAHLLQHKPPGERWAVLINEFGQIGLDAALLTTVDDGIALGEVAGGCLCCVNGAPFQIGLARLLRQSRPDRLLIEPSGLGHPLNLLQQLHEAPWRGVLNVQPLVIVLDAAALAEGHALADSQVAALGQAGLIVLNKAGQLGHEDRASLTRQLPLETELLWTDCTQVSWQQLPRRVACSAVPDRPPQLPTSASPPGALWRSPQEPICEINAQAQAWSIGWRWHPSRRFDLPRLTAWLATLDWQRAKMVVQGEQGWHSANALDNQPVEWRSSEWRRDSRLELIFATPGDAVRLQSGLQACLLP
jgi:G3E family GTPase